MGPMSVVNVHNHNITNGLAMIDLLETTIRSPVIGLWLMSRSEVIYCVGWHKQSLDQ